MFDLSYKCLNDILLKYDKKSSIYLIIFKIVQRIREILTEVLKKKICRVKEFIFEKNHNILALTIVKGVN